MNQEKTISTGQNNIALQVKNLVKRYNNFTAVDNITFDINKNEIFGLLGPNGAGKTTTINMICGLIPITEGSVEFTGFSQKDSKKLIGYCPQENIYYPKLTCLEQLIFMGQIYGMPSKGLKKQATNLLELLGLKDKANVWAAKLSGGMKRRLNICLALIHNPEILILDEPEAGLDPQSRILVRDFIRTFSKEKTIILTTHNMDEADRLANRVAIIDHGKLLLLNSPQNLKHTIGEGDILEISFEKIGNDHNMTPIADKLNLLSLNFKFNDEKLIVKHTNILDFLPEIKNTIENNGLTITEFKLRENTLEDVFIHLTGRSLRQ